MKIFKYIVIVILICSSTLANSQTIKELQTAIERAQKEIELNTKLISSTKKEETLNLSQLKMILARIGNRKSIINSMDKQARIISNDIYKRNINIKALNGDIKELREDYSAMIVSAHKNYKLNNYLLFLFSSEDFNDATQRITYMKRYNEMRKLKAVQIDTLCNKLELEISELNNKYSALNKTKEGRKRELSTLAVDEIQYRNNIAKLRNKQSSITSKVKKDRSIIDKAQKHIEEIIAEEAKKNQTIKNTATAEELRHIADLSGRFDQNIGKLPYPIANGVIVDRFGIHAHPTISGLKVNNKGINIAGKRNAYVYSIFEGTVSRVLFLPGLNNCIMIRHGNYITVYSNLSSVSVKNGDTIGFNDVIGRLSDSTNSDDCILHFEIWKETTNLNPERYLKR